MTLEDEFHRAMVGVYEVAKERGYNANYFLQMLGEYGGLATAKRLLADGTIQYGLWQLKQLGLLGHSMEAAVIEERFRSLFTEEEVQEARRRLDELGYFKQMR